MNGQREQSSEAHLIFVRVLFLVILSLAALNRNI